MAVQDHRVSRATDGVAIALLRCLRAGAEIPFVHHIDVCSAAPADLVANLMPAPGTDQTEEGYNSIWYFYYPKRYKNAQGNLSGHRQRAIGTGSSVSETTWHSELRKNVHGSEGGTYCNLSYGSKKDGSLERKGWCMVEYDFVDKQAANTAASNYVLCKVYRPSRAKGKSSSSSSSKSAAGSSKANTTARSSSSSCSKRKASGDIPKARPTKLIHQELVQVQHGSTFTNDYPMPCYEHQHVDHAMFGGEQPYVAPEHDGEFVQTEYGPMPSWLAHINVDELICYQELFGAEEEQGLQQPSAEKKLQADEFIEIPSGLVAVEDMLGPEMMPGECIGMPTASTPVDDDFFVGMDLYGAQQEAKSRASSGHTPSWSTAPSSSAGCSTLVQEPPLWLPYLMCS